jgi:hypothetical protein
MGSLYVNFIPDGDEARVTDAYGANYERLVGIKRRLDPDNLFRANQNIDGVRDVRPFTHSPIAQQGTP